MTPIQTPHCNTVLKRPKGMSEKQCGDLPVLIDEGSESNPPSVTSFWKPNQKDLENLIKGGTVMLTVQGSTHPPVALNTIWH